MFTSTLQRAFQFALFTVFSFCLTFSAQAQTFTVLHNFSFPDGRPNGPLVASGTILYGTTQGANGGGEVYAFDTSNNNKTELHAFGGSNDGSIPTSSLLLSGSTLFGTTSAGGANGFGTIFSCDAVTGNENVLYSFPAPANFAGLFPPSVSSLIQVGSTLYGTQPGIGGGDLGSVFAFDTSTNSEKTIYSFQGQAADGARPDGPLLLSGSTLYGTTAGGGNNNEGTIFAINTTNNTEKVLYSFSGDSIDGAGPHSALTMIDSTLYGAADQNVFAFNTTTNKETTVHLFSANTIEDGSGPLGSFVASGSILYGTTANGGTGTSSGTVFSIDTATDAIAMLHSFDVGDGAGPFPLFLDGSTLYGVTSEGGSNGAATLYSISVPEPTSASILGIVALGLLRRRQRELR